MARERERGRDKDSDREGVQEELQEMNSKMLLLFFFYFRLMWISLFSFCSSIEMHKISHIWKRTDITQSFQNAYSFYILSIFHSLKNWDNLIIIANGLFITAEERAITTITSIYKLQWQCTCTCTLLHSYYTFGFGTSSESFIYIYSANYDNSLY